jgi:outer membrane receptor protein involved in Fe transport
MKKLQIRFSLGFVLLALLVCAPCLNAQTSKGILAGVVKDSTGAVLANAHVTVVNQDTGESRTLDTRTDGTYRVDAISPGPYTITVAITGFATFTIKDVNVNASVVSTYDPVLSVGTVTTNVTIEAAANTINTENGSLSGTIGAVEIQNVPIFTLNPIELATTVPGVQLVQAGGNSNGVNLEVNGLRPRDNNFLIDGQDINDNSIAGQAIQPNIPDIFSQVSVLTNSSSAEFGRGGGGIVNLVTKSGTNKFHGSGWWLYSGSGLSALNGQQRESKPLPPGALSPKARANTQRYGFTIGGPIFKNKLFAFGGAQWTRTYGTETPSRLTVPDAAGLAILNKVGGSRVALLEQYLAGIVGVDPTTGGVTAPVTSQDLGARPSCNPNCVVTYGYYTRPAPAQQNTNTQWTYKIDYLMTKKDSFAFRYLHARNLLTPDFFNFPASLPGLDTNQGGPSEQFGATYTHVFSPKLLNEFRASETRIDFRFNVTPQAVANPLFPLPTLTVGALPSLGVSSAIPQGRGHDIYQFQDTIEFTKGQHTVRIGADVSRLIVRDFIPFNSRGTIGYTAGGSTSTLANYVDDFAGASGSVAITYGDNRVDAHVWQTGYFAQDDYKMTRDLTLNLGVRYEYDSNPENTLAYPAININTVLTDPYNAVIPVKEDTNNIAPRLGFAFSPHGGGGRFFGGGKTVLRGGVGIFYDTVFTNITDNSQAASPNAVASLSQITTGRGTPNASTAIATLPTTGNPLNTVTSVDSHQVNPITYQYNVGVEQELPANSKLSIFYVGTRGEKLFAQAAFNYFGPTGARLNPARGAIAARGNYGDSNYNSMQAEVDHNFQHGVFARGSYTYGKALDDATDVFVQFDTNTVYPANLAPGGIHNEWSRSAFDHRHFLSLIYVWALPGAHSSNTAFNGFLSAVTNHWTISGTSQFQTGPPTSAGISSVDTNGDGQLNDRPYIGSTSASIYTLGEDGTYVPATTCGTTKTTYTPGVIYDLTAVQSCTKTGTGYVTSYQPIASASAHWIIAPGISPTRRNTIPSPGYMLNNVAVQKDFPLSFIHHLEGHSIQLRVEAQDVANHNNVQPYNTLVNNLAGSQVNGTPFINKSNSRATDGRNLRVWAKYQF